MRRFLVPPDVLAGVPPGGEVVLRGREAHHAAVVLRLRQGDEIAVFDGAGTERVVAISDVSPVQVVGQVLDTRPGITPPVRLILLQGVAKGAKMDDVIRMGTELGVGRFLPLRTRRAVGESRGRVDRWRRIASAAAAQSLRADVPTVSAPQTVAEALEQLPSDALLLVLWEGERSRTIGAALRAGPVSGPVAVLVGPEGGLTEEEVALAVSRGGIPVTLGPLVLRTETAGMAALAMVLYERALRG